MTEQERASFLNGAAARAPGKRRIKPTLHAQEDIPDEDDSDEEFLPAEGISDMDDGEDDEDHDQSMEDSEDSGESSDIEIINEKRMNGNGRLDPLVCSICLNGKHGEDDRVIQCDKCGVAVHEGCYGVEDAEDDEASVVSNFSTEPWFCEPCLFKLEKPPHCELCPNLKGAFKRLDVGGKWVHLICALYTPGISFGDVATLSAVSYQEIDFKRFGRKACDGCNNPLSARTGIATGCEAGLCKNHYHVTCAQRLGLLIDAESDHTENVENAAHKSVDPHFILCRVHSTPEMLAHKKRFYALFAKQEDKRFSVLSHRLLNGREQYKLLMQRKQYDARIKAQTGITIHLPSVNNKRARLLQTSADYMDAFIEKAELFGLEPKEFHDRYTRLPPSQISYLGPAFSTDFVRYFKNREETVIPEEQKRLHEDTCELKKVKQAEADLHRMLDALTKSPEKLRTDKEKESLDKKFAGAEDIQNAMSDVKRFPIVLYKRILRLHYGLPPEMKLMGDTYVKDEFRRHKTAPPDVALKFLKEWVDYCSALSKQLSTKGIVKGVGFGADMKPEDLDKFSEDQIRQLYELRVHADEWKQKIVEENK